MAYPKPHYSLIPITAASLRRLCERYHGYGGAGKVFAFTFGVVEEGRVVAAYGWSPPPPGAAKSVCPESPGGVLALSRMVACPKEERRLRHISTPLRKQMRQSIDRSRWPVLLTYSDESLGHTGHVYKCAGWEKTRRVKTRAYVENGVRVSPYRNGKWIGKDLPPPTDIWIQRWEHHIAPRGCAADVMAAAGWKRVPIPGKKWRSGNPAFTWAKCPPRSSVNEVPSP